MKFNEIKGALSSITNDTCAPLRVGKVERALWQIPDVSSVRFLRFGFNMPGEHVFFGKLNAGDEEIESISLLMLKCDNDEEMVLLGYRSYEYCDGSFILRFAADGKGFEVAAMANYDDYTLDPGESVGTDEIVVLRGTDYNKLLEEWAKICAGNMGFRIPDHIPTGWNDWQFYRNEKTQEDIISSCDALKVLKDQGWPLEFVQIDGGFCMYLSEWSQPKPEFSMGIPAISKYVRDAGFRFGLWFAPYIQNVKTKVVQEHPEWLLKDKEGKVVELGESNVGHSCLIDYTVPGALDWLREKVKMLVNEWHVQWIKLDGPNITTYRRGVLQNKKTTFQQMLRTTLKTIAEAAGDVLIEGEGDMTAALGCVDLHRVQTDNHMMWFWDNDTNIPYAPRVYGKELIMSFLHNIWWCNHRENIILRDYPSPFAHVGERKPGFCEQLFTANERRVQLASAMIAPGGLLLTDPMAELIRRPELLADARMLFPPAPGRAEILDPFPADNCKYPHYVELDTGTKRYLAVFNWGETTKEFSLPEGKKYSSLFHKVLRENSLLMGARSADLMEEI